MMSEPEILELQGRVVPFATDDPTAHFVGRVRFDTGAGADQAVNDDGHPAAAVEQVLARRAGPPDGVRQVDVGDSFIYPGLSDLHSHLGFATLPMWDEPSRTKGPWLHRDLWPGAPSYKEHVSWPAYAYMKGAPEALLAYAQVRALAGGTTTIQGWPPAKGSPTNRFVRSVDDDIDRDAVRTSVINLKPSELDDRREHLDEDRTLVYHLSEGQLDSKVAREFSQAAVAGCLRYRLIAIHCCAVGPDQFKQWKLHAELAGEPAPGGVVWSPLSNLWLYGETTDVVAAMENDITVCLGSDWGPSGTKNLLGEMKVAVRWIQRAGLDISPFQLAAMATANPGDLLERAWGRGPGRFEPNRMADAVVIKKRHDDPFKNLVLAREQDVELVVMNGRAVYGDRSAMRAAGERLTTAVRFGGRSKHVPLRRPDSPKKRWTWTSVMRELADVQADPVLAIENGLNAEAAQFDDRPDGEQPLPRLILESDMPGGPGSVAGPPPPGTVFDAPPLPTIVHDRTWHRSLRGSGWHDHVLDDIDDLFRADGDWT